jgi:hypothetical protein
MKCAHALWAILQRNAMAGFQPRPSHTKQGVANVVAGVAQIPEFTDRSPHKIPVGQAYATMLVLQQRPQAE